MNYNFIQNADSKEVDTFVVNHSQNSLNQSSPWIKVKDNWDSLLTCVKDDNNEVVASALILFRKLPLGKTLAYIPKGPVLDYQNEELVKFVFANIIELAKKRKAVLVRVDPVVLSRKYFYTDRNEDMPLNNTNVVSLLESLGAKHKGYTLKISDTTQPRFNAVIDVDENWEDKLEHKTKKCINSAKRKGVKVHVGREYLKDFYKAIRYTENRKGIALRDLSYFEHMMDVYGDKAICMSATIDLNEEEEKLINLLDENKKKLESDNLTKKEIKALNQTITNDEKELERVRKDKEKEEDNPIITCGILAVYNDNLMELLYMGNNPKYMRYYSSYLLYYSCINRCKELGIKHCSFGGIEGSLDDGLTLFKSNWPMQVEEYIGEFNFIFDKVMYFGLEKLYPSIRDMIVRIRNK